MAQPAIIPFRVKAQGTALERQERPVISCITGEAQTVYDKVADMLYPARTTQFLLKALRKGTFDAYGYHRENGTDVHACRFHLATWARILECPKQTVIRTRDRLVTAQVIWFEPDPQEPGYGRIGWNMHLDEWQPIGPTGGARDGAGNPRFKDPAYQVAIHTLKDTVHSLKDDALSNCECSSDAPSINVFTATCHDSALDVAAPSPVIKDANKDQQESDPDANASLVDAAHADTTSSDSSAQQKRSRRSCHPPEFDENDAYYKRAIYLRSKIHQFAPRALLPDPTIGGLKSWREEFRLMAEVNKYTPEEMKTVIDYIAKTAKWKSYVLSAKGLRRWFDAIYVEQTEKRGANTPPKQQGCQSDVCDDDEQDTSLAAMFNRKLGPIGTKRRGRR
jgi:hypothetical protein